MSEQAKISHIGWNAHVQPQPDSGLQTAASRKADLSASPACADADLLKALELAGDEMPRPHPWLAIGQNREKNLKNRAYALAAYREITEKKHPSLKANFTVIYWQKFCAIVRDHACAPFFDIRSNANSDACLRILVTRQEGFNEGS